MVIIEETIDKVYKEAIRCEYKKTPARLKAIENIVEYLKGDVIYDYCPEEKELINLDSRVKPLMPDKDMHYYLEDLEPLGADMIVVRHVLEHSIMPLVLLVLLAKHTKQLLVVVPECTKPMITYLNHYSVMNQEQLTHLANRAGWKTTHLLNQTFQGTGTREDVYLLTKK